MEKVQLTHPEGKKAIRMDSYKYKAIKAAFLNYLKKEGPSSFTDIWQAVAYSFEKNKTKFEGSVQWHTEWVKLDLEANKIIRRIKGTSPQQYELVE